MERPFLVTPAETENIEMPNLPSHDVWMCSMDTIKADEKKIEAAEMWFYRRLLRVKCTEKRTNQSVSKEIGSLKQMLETINVRKLKYVGHICRHTDTGLMLNVLQGKTQSARKRGRPPISYIENIKKSLGLNLQNLTYESQDRNRWRHIVDRA